MSAPDRFPGGPNADISAFTHGWAITPNDTTDLVLATRGIMVTVAGDVDYLTQDGATAKIPAAQPGTIYPHKAARVLTTSAATGIWGYV